MPDGVGLVLESRKKEAAGHVGITPKRTAWAEARTLVGAEARLEASPSPGKVGTPTELGVTGQSDLGVAAASISTPPGLQ